jgi:hypothetical protein
MSKCSDCKHADVVGWAEYEMIDICKKGFDMTLTLFGCEGYEPEKEEENEQIDKSV